MNNDPRLERYLSSLEKALKPFPVSDRADIITEIKSHVFSALERDPQTRLDTILTSLGEPETVANRYLLERGLKPAHTSISPIVKWLVIGFLGTFAMILIFAGYMVVHFDSIVKVDSDKDRIQVLGGLIDVQGKKNQFSFGDNWAFTRTVEVADGDLVAVTFKSGKFEVQNSEDRKLTWSCRGQSEPLKNVMNESHTATLDFSSMKLIQCTLNVPSGVRFSMKGENGKVEFESPSFDVDADIDNGKVAFHDDGKEVYNFKMSVTTGSVDTFKSSTAVGRSIKVHVNNGKISR